MIFTIKRGAQKAEKRVRPRGEGADGRRVRRAGTRRTGSSFATRGACEMGNRPHGTELRRAVAGCAGRTQPYGVRALPNRSEGRLRRRGNRAYKKGGGKPYYQQRGASPVGVAPQRSEQWKTPNAMQTAKQIPPSRAADSPRPSRRTARAARIPRLAGTANKRKEKEKIRPKGRFFFYIFPSCGTTARVSENPAPYCSRGRCVV